MVVNIECEALPFEDNSVDVVQAWHVLEHVHNLIGVLQEIYRVCKPDAYVGIIVPHPRHDVFLNDPTHVRAVTPDSMAMFSRRHCEDMEAKGAKITDMWKHYGVNFDIVGPIRMVLDPSIDPHRDDWRAMERRLNNIVIEYRFGLRVVK